MPLTTRKIKDKWRIVEKDTGKVAKNKGGTALDGGGHPTQPAADKQVSAISVSKAKAAGHKIPSKWKRS